MRNKIRPISIILLLAILGFMIASISCTGVSPKTQAKIDQAAEKYEDTTGITPTQTGGLLLKWFGDYNQAKAANTPPVAILSDPAK